MNAKQHLPPLVMTGFFCGYQQWPCHHTSSATILSTSLDPKIIARFLCPTYEESWRCDFSSLFLWRGSYKYIGLISGVSASWSPQQNIDYVGCERMILPQEYPLITIARENNMCDKAHFSAHSISTLLIRKVMDSPTGFESDDRLIDELGLMTNDQNVPNHGSMFLTTYRLMNLVRNILVVSHLLSRKVSTYQTLLFPIWTLEFSIYTLVHEKNIVLYALGCVDPTRYCSFINCGMSCTVLTSDYWKIYSPP